MSTFTKFIVETGIHPLNATNSNKSIQQKTWPVFFIRWIFVLLMFAGFATNAQINITNPGNTTPALSATYSSLELAIADVNATTAITGPVTITLSVAQTAPAGGYSITAIPTGASNINRIIFDGGGNNITAFTPQPSGNLNDGIFKLIGADFITIQNFVMQENASNTNITAVNNNMTEWAVALLYATTTNGAQNIMLQNNTISLNRAYQNTWGIYANATHSATGPATAATATTAAGGNSGLVVYSNTISNVNNGILVVGSTGVADYNDNIDIGGTSAATANTITNWGRTGTFSTYANVPLSVNGILVMNSTTINISFNIIASSVGGVTSASQGLNGINIPNFTNNLPVPVGTFTNSINNNNISLQVGATGISMVGIRVSGNTLSPTSTLNINFNDFNNFGRPGAAVTSSIRFILSVASPAISNINNNTFSSISINTGSMILIENNSSIRSGTFSNIKNNSIVNGLNNTGGGFTGIYSLGASEAGGIKSWDSNNFSNVVANGPGTGINDFDLVINHSITNNTISNITVNGLFRCIANWNGGLSGGSAGANNVVSGNTISNITSTGEVVGIDNLNCTGATVTNNTVSGLTSTGAFSVTGISSNTSSSGTIGKNTICNLSATHASGTVNGILVTAGALHAISNNRIGDLRTPAANAANPVNGISITGGTNVNAYFNTVHLNAASSGALFGSSAISVSTTPTVTLNNNIFSNSSTVKGTGLAVAYRRSNATLTTYGTASDRNDFMASTIYTDGVTPKVTLASYKALVGPTIDANSVAVTPPFLSSTCGNANFLKINIATPTQIESSGASVAGITDDFENDIRFGNGGYVGTGTAPDLGADEFNGIPAAVCGATPASSTINAPNAVCPGFGTTLSLSSIYTDIGIVYQWTSGTIAGGPYPNTLGTSAIQATGPLTVATYYVCVITCTNSGLSFTTVEKEVAINVLPAVTATPSFGSYCTPGGSAVSITAGGAVTYTWLPVLGITPTTGAVVSASPTSSTTYTVTGTDANGCINTATSLITAVPSLTLTSVTATPAAVCSGSNSQLLAVAVVPGSNQAKSMVYASNTGQSFESIPSPTIETTVTSGTVDDGYKIITPSPAFTFNYIGTNYNIFAPGTNGYIALGSNTVAIPTTITSLSPLNVVYAFGRDGNLNTVNGGSLTHGYDATGTKYVFEYVNYSGGASGGASATIQLNYQIILWGAASADPGRIDIIYGSSLGTPASNAVIGIRDNAGTFINGVNGSTTLTTTAAAWPISGQMYTFAKAAALAYLWTPSTFIAGQETLANPLATAVTATTTYTVTATAGGCSTSGNVTVNVIPLTCSPAIFSATRCAAGNFTVTAQTTGGGTPLNYVWSDGSPTVYANAASITANLPAGTYNFTCLVTDACGASCNSAVTVVVNALPTVTVSPSTGLICKPGGSAVGLAAGGATTYTWLPVTGLTPSTGATVSANPTSATTYTVTGTDANGCVSTATSAITVGTAITSPTAVASPNPVCVGATINLTSSASVTGYTMNGNSGVSFIDISGSGVSVGTLGDDTEHNITTPSFTYNGIAYTTARVGNNGAIVFGSASGEVTHLNAALPSTANTAGNAFLAPYWDDLDVQLGATVKTETVGNLFIIQYTNSTHDAFVTGAITFQVQLDLITGKIHFVYQDVIFGNATYDAAVNATIGLNFNSTTALQYSHLNSSLVNGQSITFTPSVITYSWTGPNGFTSALQNPSLANVQVADGGVYTVNFSSASGCGNTASTTHVIVTGHIITSSAGTGGSISPAGTQTLCSSANATYTIIADPGYAISDVIVDGISQGAVASYTFTNLQAAHTISATFVLDAFIITSSAGAGGTITPIGSTSVNAGSNQSYTIAANTCFSIADVIVDDVSQGVITSYTFTNVQANHTISATFIQNGPYAITVTAGANGAITPGTGNVNCGENASYTITPNACFSIVDVIVDGFSQGVITTYTFTNVQAVHTISATFVANSPLLAPVVTGFVNVCPYINTGDQIVYTATSAGATGYTWVVPPSNVTIISGQGTANLTVTFQTGFVAQANKQIKVTATSACGNSPQTINYLLTQIPSTPQPITGITNVCAIIGTPATYTYTIPAVTGATSYIWTGQAGSTVINNNGTSANISFSNGFTTSAITVQAVNGCGTSSARSLAIVRANPSTPGLIAGPSNACPHIAPGGTAATYSVALVSGATSYTWTVPAGSIGLTGQGSSTISFKYPSGFTTGTIGVTSTNGCGTSAARTKAVNTLYPATPGVIDVIQLLGCPNREYSYTLAAMPANAQSLQWTVPSGGTILSGQGTTSIQVSYLNSSISGAVGVMAISNCGNSVIRTTAVKIPVCPTSFAGKDNNEAPQKYSVVSNNKPLGENFSTQLFPNPTNNVFNLKVITAEKETIQVRLMDATGRLIKHFVVQPYQLMSFGAELKAGIYMVEVKQGKNNKSTRVVKY